MDVVMTIAGADSGGGAGIQADLKTFQELKVFGTTVITALTAQNTLGVQGIFPTSPDFVLQQLTSVFSDFHVKAVKTGMLFSAEIIEVIANYLQQKDVQLVIDPVMIAKGGESLLQKEAVDALKNTLLPIATVLTPNIPEAEVISGIKIENEDHMTKAAHTMLQYGVQCVVMKGGHSKELNTATDKVYLADGTSFSMISKRIHTKHTHGTGCTFSAAITSFLARGLSLKEAMIEAKKFVQLAIENPLNIGHGHGPTNHFAYQQRKGQYEVIVDES
ncbi:bifunctional hydroxymethylpyrimidine kinase/phosphomethylpyrimidine kinase [Lysinibacillus halotolerans]|uniref:Hydroxymethylpyrimidine/phosphomethylpyrimidine kinase n=1 Tax=Lysinibacillus halotolerans TaxID=1368476 RepID=A0A3M8HH84_9BACI|nr:bifunctional hydroxymethylpyrimidine kinase/phosphomethylpyrimidine kinase [Lysinibacillus halotolerans]RND01394.1 bifunctional hydroxymethylpyrimidine kinase/phosphomethylpyrimidine kinase [Lysinibacillus halotolerans]